MACNNKSNTTNKKICPLNFKWSICLLNISAHFCRAVMKTINSKNNFSGTPHLENNYYCVFVSMTSNYNYASAIETGDFMTTGNEVDDDSGKH